MVFQNNLESFNYNNYDLYFYILSVGDQLSLLFIFIEWKWST